MLSSGRLIFCATRMQELIAGFELSEGKIFTSLHRGNRFSVFMAWSKCYVGIFIRLGRSLLLLGVIANCGSVVLEGPGYNNSDQIAFCLVLCVAVCIQLIYSSKVNKCSWHGQASNITSPILPFMLHLTSMLWLECFNTAF